MLKTAGQLSLVHIPKPKQQEQEQQQQQTPEDPTAAATTAVATTTDTEAQAAEELAAMVWRFVNSAGGLVEELDGEVSSVWLLRCLRAVTRLLVDMSLTLSHVDYRMN